MPADSHGSPPDQYSGGARNSEQVLCDEISREWGPPGGSGSHRAWHEGNDQKEKCSAQSIKFWIFSNQNFDGRFNDSLRTCLSEPN